METAKFLPWSEILLIAVVVVLVAIAVTIIVRERRIVASRYEWLDVLNGSEWKSTIRMGKEMKRMKKVNSISLSLMYADLDRLEEEGLVTSKMSPQIIREQGFQILEYRLTAPRLKKKNEIHDGAGRDVLSGKARAA